MRLFGHPVHPMLIVFPLGLLALVPLWDLLAWVGLLEEGGLLARYFELAGLVGGGLAALTGVPELLALPRASRGQRTAFIHAGLAATTLSLFLLALLLRPAGSGAPGLAVLALEFAGAALLGLTGWFGGELVFRHGVGVEGDQAGLR
ncbi:MAG: DUF2231 domain-containing protein [Myxococcota bacterium]|jgi:uncharacterized membrane protein|nr:DUF2231 domain-containing protein [Myxococcota bacterium]